MVRSIALASLLLAATVGICRADEARADKKWPSIIYYGEGLNQRIDGALFWEGQAGALTEQRQRQGATGYGAISAITGNPRTTHVSGYTRKDGTRVQPYYRSRR
ncbi:MULTISPECIES: hypothetical protein [unclassified Mesorhizobium]|uniref:hypothetical protein n=1 Tax=unclassified Mesorhizobium TaxID=325217 RepID=UPI003335DAD8